MVIATMALGIGLNTAVFSLLDALLLRPPAVVAPERLVHVYSSVSGEFLSHTPMPFPTTRRSATARGGSASSPHMLGFHWLSIVARAPRW